MPRKDIFPSARHNQLSKLFIHNIFDSCDHMLTDMFNFIFIHISLDGTMVAIDHFISLTLVMWVQYKTLLFPGILI